ncbi:MAG: hypothetical protein GC150_11580 [Rhizobiales bacterium]|nr:hypothetical protein [Hyphomicrobiales bacterium]
MIRKTLPLVAAAAFAAIASFGSAGSAEASYLTCHNGFWKSGVTSHGIRCSKTISGFHSKWEAVQKAKWVASTASCSGYARTPSIYYSCDRWGKWTARISFRCGW